MRIDQVWIENYKCFESATLEFGPRFTVLVGQNNAGKTAFLEAIRPAALGNKPHRKPEPRDGTIAIPPQPNSVVKYRVSFSGEELRRRILARGGAIHLPLSQDYADVTAARRLFSHLLGSQHIGAEVVFREGAWRATDELPLRLGPAPWKHRAQVNVSENRQHCAVATTSSNNTLDTVQFIGDSLASSVYVFRAERMNIGEATIDGNSNLNDDAGNLASALLQLASDVPAQEALTSRIREIFPTIYDVRSRPLGNSKARVEVINRDMAEKGLRPGVTVPLSESGTGISQVVAILYVIAMATSPRTVVIDEPNSFLHPGAAKKLMEVLKRSKHQLVITTHSAEIIRTVDPDFLHLLRWDGGASTVATLDASSRTDQERILAEIGVSLSDVFGSDTVLWVEGRTEEICFPLLLRHAGIAMPASIAIVAVTNPDDLLGGRKSRPDIAWHVYERISHQTALLPPALAFSFDRELRAEALLADLKQKSHGLVHFLPRRAYENYLLDADAIAAVLATVPTDKKPPASQEVAAWLAAHSADPKYFHGALPADAEARAKVINAPLLLMDAFDYLATTSYVKTKDSVALTEWLLTNKPKSLKELIDYVRGLVDPVAAVPGAGGGG